MVAIIDLKSIIPKIIKNVSFREYLLKNNYKKKDKYLDEFECYSKDFGFVEDIIYLSKIDKQEIYLSLTFNDKGNIIDFVKNRIEIDDDQLNFEPNKDHLIEACKKLVEFLSEVGSSKDKINLETTKEVLAKIEEKTFTVYYKAEPILEYDFFNFYGIKKNIVDAAPFKNRIFSTVGLIINDVVYDKVINIAFPIYNEYNKECGLYYSNIMAVDNKTKEEVSLYVPGSVKNGVWSSNKTLNSHKNSKVKVTIVNRPIEALAHYSYLNEDRLYFAVFEQDETTYEIIKKTLNQQNSSLHLAFNVSIENFEKEIKFIIAMLDVNISFVKSNYDTIVLKIDERENKYFQKLFQKIKTHNNNKIAENIKKLGEAAHSYLKNDLILASVDENDNLLIFVPKNFKTLYQLEKILIKSFPSKIDMFIEKPRNMTWTKQNKLHNKKKITIDEEIESAEIFVLNN